MIEHRTFDNGFEYIEIRNRACLARIALQGAHLFHYCRHDEEPVVWLSEKSFFKAGTAIRGGVPVCWPWFGAHPDDSSLPQHGFARTSMWERVESAEPEDTVSTVTMRLGSSEQSRALWPHDFELLLQITAGRVLVMKLVSRNLDERPFEITSALHSYLAVSAISRVRVEGLDGTRCFDKVSGAEFMHHGDLRIDREVDRVFQQVRYPLLLHDGKRIIRIDAEGSRSAVVWNPWMEKCSAMADMPEDGYRTMVCIEAANALDDARQLGPGEEHALAAVIS